MYGHGKFLVEEDGLRSPPSSQVDRSLVKRYFWFSDASCIVDLAKAAILVIDMQNDFCHPDGWLAHIGVDINPARKPIDPLNQLLPALRAVDVPVIWVN